jgi:hypothetical protein
MASFPNVRPDRLPSDLSEGIRMPCVPLAVAAHSSAAIRIVSALSELATPGADFAMHLHDRMRVSA